VILGHIAGVPVEETLLSLAPVGVVGLGVAVATARERIAAFWRRLRPSRRAARPRP
jgi:hypothetical protein